MGWILFHKHERGIPHKLRWYKTHKGAMIGMHAANRNAGNHVYMVMEEEYFDKKYNPMVKVRSLMTGAEVEIPAQDRGTCVDPSTERYWSM